MGMRLSRYKVNGNEAIEVQCDGGMRLYTEVQGEQMSATVRRLCLFS